MGAEFVRICQILLVGLGIGRFSMYAILSLGSL